MLRRNKIAFSRTPDERTRMSDTVIAALITVGGIVATAITAAIVQIKITRMIISSEYRKVGEQIVAETRARRSELRASRMLDHVSGLIDLVDPEINESFDYPAIVARILRVQLFLNRTHPLEKDLNRALNNVGHAARAGDRSTMLGLSDNLIEATQTLMNHYYANE